MSFGDTFFCERHYNKKMEILALAKSAKRFFLCKRVIKVVENITEGGITPGLISLCEAGLCSKSKTCGMW